MIDSQSHLEWNLQEDLISIQMGFLKQHSQNAILIYVVDSTNRRELEISSKLLSLVLQELPKQSRLLIFANKSVFFHFSMLMLTGPTNKHECAGS